MDVYSSKRKKYAYRLNRLFDLYYLKKREEIVNYLTILNYNSLILAYKLFLKYINIAQSIKKMNAWTEKENMSRFHINQH